MFRLPPIVSSLIGLGAPPDERLAMREETCRVSRRAYRYGVVEGDGPSAGRVEGPFGGRGEGHHTIVLLHGWGLAHGSYRATASAIAHQGFRVVVPDMPGFGDSSELPLFGLSFSAYAKAMRRFLEYCPDIDGEPVHLVGHSFGGAVAAQMAHDAPHLVRSAVLVSSVGAPTWHRDDIAEHPVTDRPIWDWGLHLVHELPVARFPVAAVELLRDLSHNVVFHLPTLGLVAGLIRRSDLEDELTGLCDGVVPVAVVWADGDHVVTRACFDDQCRALGVEGTIVEGNHGWPLARPDSFGRTIGAIIRTLTSASGSVAPLTDQAASQG